MRNTPEPTKQGVVVQTLLLALMWWMLTEGTPSSWWVGAPVILLAVLASTVLLPTVRWSWVGLLRFIPFFLWRSLCGGVDVAKRALHPRLPISPRMHDHRWRLPPGLPQVFMANTVSLLPGTLSAQFDEKHLRVHVLDQTGAFTSKLVMIEARVARVFGLSLVGDGSEE